MSFPATRAAASLPGSARLARLAAALRREAGVFEAGSTTPKEYERRVVGFFDRALLDSPK
jgi:hypothetical protein